MNSSDPFSGVCAVVSIVISGLNTLDHLLHYTEPTVQRFIVRILLIVPIYSVYSWYVT